MTISQSQKELNQLLSPSQIKWFRQELLTWAQSNWRDFPWRLTSEPYSIFVAEFLRQKTDATKVIPIYESFLAKYPTLQDLARAPVEEIASLLQPLGLFFRAQRISQSARILVEEYQGNIPDSENQLLKLPGVGRYTARSICANAYQQPLALLDSNVARILERFFGLAGGKVKSRCPLLWQAAAEIAPKTEVGKWNLTLFDFGAKVCKAPNPLCLKCPLQKHCHYQKPHF